MEEHTGPACFLTKDLHSHTYMSHGTGGNTSHKLATQQDTATASAA